MLRNIAHWTYNAIIGWRGVAYTVYIRLGILQRFSPKTLLTKMNIVEVISAMYSSPKLIFNREGLHVAYVCICIYMNMTHQLLLNKA